jgi:beta-glucosidase
MVSFNSWNGDKLHGHKQLLTGVLKEQMGFDGILVTDWNGIGQVKGCNNQSCAQAINAGVDMIMVPKVWKKTLFNLIAQVKRGEVPMARIDDAVTRILRVKLRAGLFEKGVPSKRLSQAEGSLIGSAEHRAVAREAVRKSLVLIKNTNNLLPLQPGQHVLVAGDGADNIGKQWRLDH